ncbi:MAG: DUF5320 domain-containing protein [Alphaproteobacteria bacterium]|nr:DUF5320 domain-containing protein [Alphaproteobacteria bacterium]
MPNMDKSGPMGTGPIGRGQGGCNGQPMGFGRRGFGRGRGCGRGFGGFVSCEKDQKSFLEENIKAHQNELTAMQKRLDELKKQDN